MERVAKLETALQYERELYLREIGSLSLRMMHLEQQMRQDRARFVSRLAALQRDKAGRIGIEGYAKVAVAILLPMSVLLVTGSHEKAAAVAVKLFVP